MRATRLRRLLQISLLLAMLASSILACGSARHPAGNPQAVPPPPDQPVKLVFIHHSCGSNWLADGNGGLGLALRDNNYFVSDSNYGWGPGGIGDRTDIGHWWTWFRGDKRDVYTQALYTESGQHSSYSRMAADPGGANEVVLFKSCYPNSNLGGKPGDAPATGANPLRGQDVGSQHMTVANAKGVYNDLLVYFEANQDKLFVAVTAPPLVEGATGPVQVANARAFNNWLVNDWLVGYAHNNVVVFDFYNVLTSNGGSNTRNDLGDADGNHHRWNGSAVEHTQTVDGNTSAYGSGGDSHPTAAGNAKATAEFLPLLNYWVNEWQGGGPPIDLEAGVWLPSILTWLP